VGITTLTLTLTIGGVAVLIVALHFTAAKDVPTF
jgi:hypothetical protein